MGFKEDVEVLSGTQDYSALALELARELKEAKKEIARLSALNNELRKELLVRNGGLWSH